MTNKLKILFIGTALVIGSHAFAADRPLCGANPQLDKVGATNAGYSLRELCVSDQDVALYVRVVGSSRNAIVAINGGPGLGSGYMEDLDRMAGLGFQVVSYDQRGVGRSTAPSSPTSYSFRNYADDLEAIRVKLGLDHLQLFGHSFGSIVEFAYATTYPYSDHLSRFAIYGGASPDSDELNQASLLFNKKQQDLQDQGFIPMALPNPSDDATFEEWLKLIFPVFFYNPKFPVPPEYAATSVSTAADSGTSAYLANFDFRPQLKTVALPVMNLDGIADPYGQLMQDSVSRALPAATLTKMTIPNCGHVWQECEGVFLKQMTGFFGSAKP